MEQEGEGQAKDTGRIAAVAEQLRKSAFQVASSTLTNIMPAAKKIIISTVGIRSWIRNFDILSK
jgi:hypothetical protein